MRNNNVKEAGKVTEQIDMEFNARRNYPRRWSRYYNETPWDDMYNPNKLSQKIKELAQEEELCPYQHVNEGDGHFVSPDMYKSLISYCRCGRPRSDFHLLRCVQKEKAKFVPTEEEIAKGIAKDRLQLPKTSSAFVGWHDKTPTYKQWEESIRYKSPVYDMPGERITTSPYNAIIIG
ncbi:uncharacterized protein LOC106088213 [Stomoxys calcitrans]|uniref:uncharacterized protein LOC106088213 n=1 Tax=Stomoxys calcitrans TaxID=35570 RepID=UPI0027E32A5A|nr:uncharacterized protein LOC106088213 [Stomoxys calcitrans]